MFSANGGINCPLDGEPIAREEIFKDNGRAREIRNLICACPYRNDGCDWTDIVGKFEVLKIYNYLLFAVDLTYTSMLFIVLSEAWSVWDGGGKFVWMTFLGNEWATKYSDSILQQ